MEKEEVLRRLNSACHSLLEHDRELLVVDANERSITHKLAEHLQVEFPDWNVDCEYNRDGFEPKRMTYTVETVLTDNTDAKTVFPDIIVHHRGCQTHNLLVIEAKKCTTGDTDSDRAKLMAYKAQLKYMFAYSVVFPVGKKASSASASIDITEVP